MIGRMGFSPDDFYRTSFVDVVIAIQGFSEGQVFMLNNVRHIMWASLAAMGSKITPRQLMPLPMDGVSDQKAITKSEFLALAKKMAEMGNSTRAKA